MATVIGSLRPEATAGETEVLQRLKELPDDYIVYPELPGYKHPDFVIIVPHRGVAILEVKDWVDVSHATLDQFTVVTRSGDERNEPHPVTTARDKALAVANKLETEPRLLNSGGRYHGKLRIPYAYAAVLPRMPSMFIHGLGPVIEDLRHLVSQDRLQQMKAQDWLDGLDWRYSVELTPLDVDLIRGTIYPELNVVRGGRSLGVLDLQQEQAAKEGLHEQAAASPEPEEELPEHGRQVATNMVIRLVRGVVGSGKTLVLTKRARYLAELHPDWSILVVTYNRALANDLRGYFDAAPANLTVTNFHQLCHELLDELGDWGSGPVNDRKGTVANLLRKRELPERLDPDFLAAEICWMKDTGLTDLGAYLEEPRVGRGRPLGRGDRQLVYDIYQAYQSNLRWRRRFDWEDVPEMVTTAVREGLLAGDRYDAILVDEAQDFAPTWFNALRSVLKPGGSLFLTADGVQRIYRKHSWRSLGLNVVGRTRILPRCYRNTYEIARSAFELLRGDESLVEALRQEDEDLPQELDPDRMRHGDHPALHHFTDSYREKKWIGRRLSELKSMGYRSDDIALFHRHRQGVNDYAGELMQAGWPVRVLHADAPVTEDGVTVATMHSAKGLEFRVVFVLQLQSLFNPERPPVTADERRASRAEETRLLYVALTRARDQVYLTHQGRLPDELTHFGRYLTSTRTAVAA